MKEIDELHTVVKGMYKKWKTDVGAAASILSPLSSFVLHFDFSLWFMWSFMLFHFPFFFLSYMPECDYIRRPECRLQLRHRQRLEGRALEEWPQISLVNRRRARHHCQGEDALCLRQVTPPPRKPIVTVNISLFVLFWIFLFYKRWNQTTWFSYFQRRIIVHGREIRSGIVSGSAQPFNFKEHFHLTEAEVKLTGKHLTLIQLYM